LRDERRSGAMCSRTAHRLLGNGFGALLDSEVAVSRMGRSLRVLASVS
jgi:hypothetical protein